MMRSSMFAVQRRAVASMAEPLLSAQQFKEAPLTSVTPDAQLTTLPNGVRVVSVARASPFVALGVAVEAGSRHETHQSSGAAFALASTFLKSSRTRSSLRVTRELEAVSNDASAEATRDFVLYRATTSREAAGSALSQLVDITAPALRHWEIEEAHEYVDHMATRALTDAALTDDLLHAAAFRGLGAGRPLVPHRHAASVELDQLRSFVLRNFVAPRLIVVASGLDADAAVSIAKAATANVPKGVAAPAPAPYVGGERFLELPSGVTHFSLALSAAGISRAVAAVLVSVIGHHNSVGAWRTVGGSGRLGKVSADTLLNASAFYTGPGPSALLGFHGVTSSPSPATKLAAARSVLETLVDPLDSQTLQGAKNRAVNELLTLYGSRNVVPFLAESVARGGSLSASALVAEIQAITAADLVAAAKKMRSTPLSVAAVGNVGGL